MAVLKVHGFKKSFNGKVVHRNVSFEVKQGECMGLVGGSGVGKSVILRSVIGLEKPDSGEVFVEDKEISRFNESQLIDIRKKVAYVFQNGALFDSMSVYENLAYPLREHTDFHEGHIDKRITEQLAEFGLEDAKFKYPAQLSGGMQKRVGLARSIILNPSIVLYDEPTAGLDPYNTQMIQEMILRLKTRGVTSIFVSHDMPVALKVCDRIALLSNGEIKAIGSPDDLSHDPNDLMNRFIKGQEL